VDSDAIIPNRLKLKLEGSGRFRSVFDIEPHKLPVPNTIGFREIARVFCVHILSSYPLCLQCLAKSFFVLF
jgi:hypothetical protein